MKPGIERKSDSSGRNQALVRMSEANKNLKRRQADVDALLPPTPLGERVAGSLIDSLSRFLNKVGLDPLAEGLREQLPQTPGARFRADLRGSVHDLDERKKEQKEQLQGLAVKINELENLLGKVEGNPDDANLLLELRNTLRAPVEEELGLVKDEEEEVLYAEIMRRFDVAQRQTERDRILAEVNSRLDIYYKTRETLRANYIGTVGLSDTVEGEYGTHMSVAGPFDAIDRAVIDLKKGAELGLTSRVFLVGQMERAVASAKAAIIAAQIASEESRKPIRVEELEDLSRAMFQLALNPAPENLRQEQKKLNPVS